MVSVAKDVVLKVAISRSGGVISPSDLPELLHEAEKALGGVELVVISGRMPVWPFGTLIHALHPGHWVATFEQRLGRGVVIASHDPSVRLGATIDLPERVVEVKF